MSIRYDARRFGVSSALARRINSIVSMNSGLGRHPLLSKQEEEIVV